jgi:hypothetical protein
MVGLPYWLENDGGHGARYDGSLRFTKQIVNISDRLIDSADGIKKSCGSVS